MLRKRKFNTANSGQDILWWHSVQQYTVSSVCSCTSSLPCAVTVFTGTTKCYIYQTVETLSWYILMCYFCDFLSLHSLGTSNVFVSSSPQSSVSLQIMFCLTVWQGTVLSYISVLSCLNCVVTVTVTDGSRKERVVGDLVEGEEGFFSKAESEVKPQIVFHILSVGHIVVLCCRKHFQICYSISTCSISI